MDYPEWLDVMWVASDRTGALAVFFTAGYAPMPAMVLACEQEKFDALEMQVLSLPENSQDPFLEAPYIGEEFARRGLYVFDWSDIHGGRLNAYKCVTMPLVPIEVSDLPEAIRTQFDVAVFDIEFKDMPVLNVRTYLECVEPAGHPLQI